MVPSDVALLFGSLVEKGIGCWPGESKPEQQFLPGWRLTEHMDKRDSYRFQYSLSAVDFIFQLAKIIGNGLI